MLQATMTVIGNVTLMLAGWWLWQQSDLKQGVRLSAIVPLLLVVPISKETLFGLSLFPYLGFLWFATRSRLMPRLALIGFYMTLVFVAVTIPAGVYAQVHYGKSLANVDWLHGSAESFLTLSNILVGLGFQQAIAQGRPQQLAD